MPDDVASKLAPSFVALKRQIEAINFKPEIKITVPEVKVPKITVPNIKIPEIKLPDIKIDAPNVTVKVDNVKISNLSEIPRPETIEYAKITEPLIEAIKKIKLSGGGGGGGTFEWLNETTNQFNPASQTLPLPVNVYGNVLIPKKYDSLSFGYPGPLTEVLTFKDSGTTICTLTIVYTDATKEFIDTLTKT
jgi:hypothetical protein